jgi:hypothetical protein
MFIIISNLKAGRGWLSSYKSCDLQTIDNLVPEIQQQKLYFYNL